MSTDTCSKCQSRTHQNTLIMSKQSLSINTASVNVERINRLAASIKSGFNRHLQLVSMHSVPIDTSSNIKDISALLGIESHCLRIRRHEAKIEAWCKLFRMPGRNAKRHTLSTKNDQSTNTRDHYVTFAPNASTHPNYKSRQFPVLVLKTMSKFHQAEF
jgi:hypothetical protein